MYSRPIPFLNDIIINWTEKVIKESLCREIGLTIRDQLERKGYTDEAVTSAILAWHEKRLKKSILRS